VLPLPKGGPLELLRLCAVAGLVSGLSSVERKGAVQLMLSRPLVLAPVLGFFLGDAQTGLWLGVPLELLFLGGVNLGGSVPQNETLLCAGLVSAVVPAGLLLHKADEPLFGLGLAGLYPLAVVGRWLERKNEAVSGAIAARVLARTEAGDPDAVEGQILGLAFPFATAALVAAACTLTAPLLAWARHAAPERLLSGLAGGWHATWALGLAVAIRSVRDPRALKVSLYAAALALLFGLLLWWMLGHPLLPLPLSEALR
jgi:mannose/fructose/N-acetylgalactosamine-specific phosphotransferase system component IIC